MADKIKKLEADKKLMLTKMQLEIAKRDKEIKKLQEKVVKEKRTIESGHGSSKDHLRNNTTVPEQYKLNKS